MGNGWKFMGVALAAAVVLISGCADSTDKHTAVSAEAHHLIVTLGDLEMYREAAKGNPAISNVFAYRDLLLADQNGKYFRSWVYTNELICINPSLDVWKAIQVKVSADRTDVSVEPKNRNLIAVCSPVPYLLKGFEGTNYLGLTIGETFVVLPELPLWARAQIRSAITNPTRGVVW